jgi:hypothetical protein
MKLTSFSIVQSLRGPSHYRRQLNFSASLCSSTGRSASPKAGMAQNKANTSIAPAAQKPPAITHILETCLMVKDIAAATDFYKNIFGIDPFLNNVSLDPILSAPL